MISKQNYWLLLLLKLALFASFNVKAQQQESNEVEFTQEEEWAWLDAMHSNFTTSVNDTANWFDGFFADESREAQQHATGSAKLTFAWEPRAGDLGEFDSRFRLRMKLPNLKERVDVIFSDYDESTEEHRLAAARNEVFPRQDEVNLALRWTSGADEDKYSTRIGIGKGAQLFTKAKYNKTFVLSEKAEIRTEPSVYYYHRDGWGAKFQVNYERSLKEESLLRFSNAFIYRDEQQDVVFQHGIYNYIQVSDRQALICGFYVEGNSKPNYQIEEYLLSTRIRRNALRSWLYFEVEPFLLWRRDEGFDTSPGVALRVQGYFGR